jgi:hypothetical protein
MPSEAPELDRLERWMQEVVMHPRGASGALRDAEVKSLMPEAAASIESVVLPSRELTSVQRLAIYANMYFWRLIEVLEKDYPTVKAVLGPERFNKLVRDYVEAHPSRHYSLSHLGEAFPRYLGEEARKVPHRGYLAAVARVERAMEEVFDAEQAEPITPEQIHEIPMESWAGARFRTIPALQLLELDYPVTESITAVREDRKVRIPAQRPSWVAVFRKDLVVWRHDLGQERFTLLSSLQQGKTLGEALEACASLPGQDLEALVPSLARWFEDWTADKLFCGIEVVEA